MNRAGARGGPNNTPPPYLGGRFDIHDMCTSHTILHKCKKKSAFTSNAEGATPTFVCSYHVCVIFDDTGSGQLDVRKVIREETKGELLGWGWRGNPQSPLPARSHQTWLFAIFANHDIVIHINPQICRLNRAANRQTMMPSIPTY